MGSKILGGLLKGLDLPLVSEEITRPTSVQLKRRLFDSNQDWSDFCVVDLCAGTGAIGIEAWSRGAQEVWLVEENRKVFRQLQESLKIISCRLPEELVKRKILLANSSVEQFMKTFERQSCIEKCWVGFVDPPYFKHNLYEDSIIGNWLLKKRYFNYLWIESNQKDGWPLDAFPKKCGDYEQKKVFEQGDSFLILYSLGK